MSMYFLVLGLSVLGILLFDALGAIISRQLAINYTQLSIGSVFIYMLIGFLGASYIHTIGALSIAGLVALIDTLLGWRIIKYFRANVTGVMEQELLEMTEPPIGMVIGVIVMSMGTAWLGTLFV